MPTSLGPFVWSKTQGSLFILHADILNYLMDRSLYLSVILIQPTTYLILSLKCIIDNWNLIYLKWNYWFSKLYRKFVSCSVFQVEIDNTVITVDAGKKGEGGERDRDRERRKPTSHSKFLLFLTFHTNSSAYPLGTNSKVYLKPLTSPCKLFLL